MKWSEALGSHNFIFVFTFFFADSGRVIYTSEKEGSDESGDGSVQKPFKTVMQVGRRGFFPYRKKQHNKWFNSIWLSAG